MTENLNADEKNLLENETNPENNTSADTETLPETETQDKKPLKTIQWQKIKENLKIFFERCGFPDKLLARFLGIYFIISSINIIQFNKEKVNLIQNWKNVVESNSIVKGTIFVALGFILMTIIHFFSAKKYRVADWLLMFAGTLMFSCSLMWRNNNYYLCIGLVLVAVVLVMYVIGKFNNHQFEKIPDWLAGAIILTTAGAVTAFVAITSVAHHKSFGTSCFDFGIFVQMYHSLVTDFTAVTTCERDKFLSHFYVHASFIYYLLAPVYAVFKSESTLLISQAILAMGGVIPLFLIARKHNYKGGSLIFMCMIYIFCSGLIGPCYYDFHENAFLPTLLMWFIYAIDRRKIILLYIMAGLVCIVKEDAPLYIICICIYFFFEEKSIKKLHGIIVSALSGVYFIVITNWLNQYGDGQMMAASRFGHLTLNGEQGFGDIIVNVLLNPAYFISTFIEEQTLLFFIQVMLPFLFLPFMTKKIHRFLLIIPFVIMNLVIGSNYGYAAKIDYQYIFGPSCLLIYMIILNCEDVSKEKRNIFVACSATASIITSCCLFSGHISYVENYNRQKEKYNKMEICLDSVPEDAAVASNTWYLPHIADRKEIYLLDNNDFEINEEEKLVISIKEIDRYDFFVMSVNDEYTPQVVSKLEEAGFILYNSIDNVMVIYQSPNYVPSK